MSELGTADIKKIMELLPHRYPFLLVDKIVDIDGDISGTGIKNVTINEPFFQGHFPGNPVMPGVLIIEAMAQTAGVICILNGGEAAEASLVYFMSIDKARFRKPVLPGDILHIHVKQVRKRGPVWKFQSQAKVDGQLVSEAEITAMIVESGQLDN